ncbi:uncharacterized protein LOC119453171 [Dermacentor silvarum]|uniref:uncharacterized protein LOC119453171 n=1 Tax=Dermacentor silvarum TaxID=543639 RepID=UPI00189A8CC4|nr:uncharacterized protein LOC119453171 [Dermacentor silvarum]
MEDCTAAVLRVAVMCGLVALDQTTASVAVMKVAVSEGQCLSSYGKLAADQSFTPPGDCARVTCDAQNEMLHIERCIASNQQIPRSGLSSEAAGNAMSFPACCSKTLV